MYHHTETEHQNYRVHRKCDYTCAVQDIENTVVAEVNNKRIPVVYKQSQLSIKLVD